MFVHVVLFWLKEDAPEGTSSSMTSDARRDLAQIPGVAGVHVGKPAMTPRDIVDNSYQVGLLVLLHDQAAHDAYQTHPLHQSFIGNYSRYWSKVQAYDFTG